MDADPMLNERCVHIVDDEAKVRDALSLLLSTAQIESRSYGSAEEYLTLNPLGEPACKGPVPRLFFDAPATIGIA